MLTSKENFLRTVYQNNPDRLCNGFEALTVVLDDPIGSLNDGAISPGMDTHDIWGIRMIWPEGDPGAISYVTNENKVIKDITKWKEQVNLPDFEAMKLDWSPCLTRLEAVNREEKLIAVCMTVGLFERLHFLMGFRDTFYNLKKRPDHVHELLDAILEVRLQNLRLVSQNLKPDAIMFFDDWGTKTGLFFSPETWREYFKERYRKFYASVRELGLIAIHHADCWCASLAEEMAEIGVQIWQGATPSNDIPVLQEKLQGKMTILGGIDITMDREGWTEEEVRAETRRACEASGQLPGFIPWLTSIRSMYPGVSDVVSDEINAYNQDVFGISAP